MVGFIIGYCPWIWTGLPLLISIVYWIKVSGSRSSAPIISASIGVPSALYPSGIVVVKIPLTPLITPGSPIVKPSASFSDATWVTKLIL